MRIKNLLRLFSLLLFFSLFDRPAEASHLYGGEMTYEYIGQFGTPTNPLFRYRIILKHYVGSSGASISDPMRFNYYSYNGTNSGTLIPSAASPTIYASPSPANTPNLVLPIPANCPVSFPLIKLLTFVHTVDLPLSFTGYYVTAVANARNSDITNIQGGNMSLYMQIPPPIIINPGSKSPVFTDTAVVVIFAGDTTSVINSAFDVDGDKLIYAFSQPAAFGATVNPFTTPPMPVTYMPGYSFAQPFGAGGYASINASTGLAKYYVPPIPGNTQDRKYVVSFQVKEYRTIPGGEDILIGSSIRDIQLVVKDLAPNNNTNPNFTFSGSRIINIIEGAAIPPINFTFSDPNTNQTLKLEVGGSLLDGPAGRNATFTTGATTLTSNTTGTGLTVTNGSTGSLNFTSICGQAGTYPLNITLTDNACPPGSKVESFQVVVAPYEGPDRINGDTTVCTNSTEPYNVIAKATATYNWRVQGGTIVGTPTNPNIQVNWLLPGRHKVTAFETSTGNCIDSVSFFVNVTTGVNLNLTASASAVCVGTPVTLNATGGTGYSWTDGSTTFTGSTLTVTPTATTTYTVTGAGITGCSGTNSVTITVNPLPTVVGTDKNVCSGQATTLQANGATTYTWTDGTNTYTGNNVNITPTATTTYTVTGVNTTTGCSSTDQVTLTVIPTPTPSLAFLANSYCKNDGPIALPAGTTIGGVAATSLNPANLAVGNVTVELSTTANGCTGITSKVVTIKAVPVANFGTLGTAYCLNAPAVSLAIAGSNFTINGTITNAQSFNPATLGVGTHTVSVTTTSSPDNCSVTSSRTVVVNPMPAPSLAFVANQYCVDAAAITLPAGTVNTVTYTVNGTTAATFNPASLGVGTYNIIMNETTPAGCASSVTKSVTVNPLPAPAFVGLNAEYCANDPVVTLASSIIGSTFTVNGVAATSFNPATLGPGNHTVVVNNTNTLTTCSGTKSQTVRVKPVPAANFGPLGTAYCANSPAVSLTSVTGSTFAINGTAITAFNPATLGVGTHTVSVTTTSTPDNCSVTATRTVVVNAIPTPSLAFLNNAYCQNSPVVTLPAGTGISYSIGSTTITSLDPASPLLTVGPNTITMTETNSSNCTVITTRTITIDPVPLTDLITGPTSLCPGITGIKYTVTNPRATSYQWVLSAGHGTIVSGQGTPQITVNWNGAASATVSVQAVNAQGCRSAATVLPVTINPILLTPQPIGPISVCQTLGAPVRYIMNNPTPGSSFNWTVTGGSVVGTAINDTIYVNWTTPGTGTIVVNESSTGLVNCFGSSVPLQITVLPSPNPNLQITGAASICENSANNQYSLNGGTGSTYVWTLTRNSVTTPLTGTGNAVNLATTTPGQYTITVLETNANSCAGLPITKVITVTPRPVVNQIVGSNMICPQNLNNLLYKVNGATGNTYTWTVTGGTFAKPTNNNDSVYVNFTENSPVKEITVTPISATGCAGTAFTMPITIDKATLQLASISTVEQNEKAVELNFSMPGNSANRQVIEIFRREAGTTAYTKVGTEPNTSPKHTDNGVQTASKVYEYRLVSFNECGDSLKTTFHNTILLNSTSEENSRNINLSWNPYLGWGAGNVDRYEIYLKADNGSFTMVDQADGTASKFTLNNVTGRGFNLCVRVKAVSKDGRFSWSNSNCLGFENKLKFYNVFTPNNDGRNDYFQIENVQLYPGNELTVYNRWGTEVLRKKDYDNTWDGKNQSPGTYYYLLKLSNGTSYKGWVEIIK